MDVLGVFVPLSIVAFLAVLGVRALVSWWDNREN